MSQPKVSSRLLSLDVLRGITIAGMIMVNNPGSWQFVYAPLGHVAWNGLTPTDLVFPFFMFIMGVSMYFSLRGYQFKLNGASWYKILKRTFVIFMIGLGLSWFSKFCGLFFTTPDLAIGERLLHGASNFEQLRILGVMQRLALCYGLGSIIACLINHKWLPWLVGVMIVAYGIVLSLGNGFIASESNIIAVWDRLILGVDHLYKDSSLDKLPLDPEGLISTFGALSHVLIGFLIGEQLVNIKDNPARIERLFVIGTILTFAGFLMHYGWPINKKIWSPSFTVVTTGLATLFLSLLIWMIDIKKINKGWVSFFESFGVNPLFIYVQAGVFSTLLGTIRVPYLDSVITVKAYIYQELLQPYLGDYGGSLLYALGFVTLNWIIGYQLYKRKIYIKI